MNEDHCPACGANVSGEAACQALMDDLNLLAYHDLHFAPLRDLAFDTYCMQHVARYCLSAKSYAAHLTRLCCGLEYDRNPGVYAALQRWLNGKGILEKPQILAFLGAKTIVDVIGATTPDDYQQRMQAWAEDVWQAYESQQPLAREWVRMALKSQGLVIKTKQL